MIEKRVNRVGVVTDQQYAVSWPVIDQYGDLRKGLSPDAAFCQAMQNCRTTPEISLNEGDVWRFSHVEALSVVA